MTNRRLNQGLNDQAGGARGPAAISSLHRHHRVDSPWFMRFAPHAPGAKRVICLPHAGCGASAFRNLTAGFFSDFEMLIIQYPGRETRLGDPCVCDLHLMVEHIVDAITPFLDQPYILFGHSMGGKIAYELKLKLKALNLPMLENLVVSCSSAPHSQTKISATYKGSDAEFVEYLRKLGGVPDEVLAVDDLMALVLPIVRSDFELLDSYRPTLNVEPLACPVTAIFSPEDVTVQSADTALWKDVAGSSFHHYSVSGGHFYFPLQSETLASVLDAGSAR